MGVFQADEHMQVKDKSSSCKAVSALLPHGLSAGFFIVGGGSDGNGPGHGPIHYKILHKSKIFFPKMFILL